MQAKVTQLNDAFEQIKDAPRQLGDKFDELKQSPGGQKLLETDARIGRYYATVKSVLWFAAGLPVLAIGYALVLATEGTTETIIVVVTATLIAGCIWMGAHCIRSAKAASEILIDDLEERVRPVRWTLRMLRKLTGIGQLKAGR